MHVCLQFSLPTVHYPVVATEYAKELCKDLKVTRELASKSIKKAQTGQKSQYDKGVKERELKRGDLVILKVQRRFKLDRPYRKVQSVTSTNAVIKLLNDKNAEPWNVSRQRLSKCHPGMEGAQPWVGHSRKLRRRRVLKRTQHGNGNNMSNQPTGSSDENQSAGSSDESSSARTTASGEQSTKSVASDEEKQTSQNKVTRSGRTVKPPLRFRTADCPGAHHVKEGKVVSPSSRLT